MRFDDDLKERIGGITGLESLFSSRDREVKVRCGVGIICGVVLDASSIATFDSLFDSNASCCCAKAHSVVEVFDDRADSAAKERFVLKAGGGLVLVAIPLLLCDAGALLVRLSCDLEMLAGAGRDAGASADLDPLSGVSGASAGEVDVAFVVGGGLLGFEVAGDVVE